MTVFMQKTSLLIGIQLLNLKTLESSLLKKKIFKNHYNNGDEEIMIRQVVRMVGMIGMIRQMVRSDNFINLSIDLYKKIRQFSEFFFAYRWLESYGQTTID